MTFSLASRQRRGITFMQTGQRHEYWMPAGAYTVDGHCTVMDRDGSHQPAVKVRHVPTGEVWYTGRDVVPVA